MLSLYMGLGGVPYYLSYVERGFTAQESIQRIIFNKHAPLSGEFDKLFQSLFDNAGSYIELVKIISQKKEGVSRADLNSLAKQSTNGGTLSERLKDLCSVGFIKEYIPWGRSKGEYYKLIDEFCLFYLQWVYPNRNKQFASNYWINQHQKPSYYAWSGYAFEAICMKHIDAIVNGLHISTASTISSWRFIPRKCLENGAQIDLVIDRTDNAISLCEIKYTDASFVIDKKYAEALEQKMAVFKNVTRTTKQIFMTMVCSNGLKKNAYSENLITACITLDDLFKNGEILMNKKS